MDALVSLVRFLATVVWLSIPLPVVIGSILLLRRFGGAASVLLLIGSGALLLERLVELGVRFLVSYAMTHQDSALGRVLWPAASSTSPTVFDAEYILLIIASLCFPVGFIWFAFRFTRRI